MSNITKVCFYDQLQNYFETILSKYQCGFRKSYNAQHCLLVMIEKWKACVDNGGKFGALLTDLSKVFDCLSHELLNTKLNAYGFSYNALKLVYNYLVNRKQRIKVIMIPLVRGVRFCLEFHKVQYWGHYFLIFSYAICFTSLESMKLPITQMVLYHSVQKFFFNGLRTII